MITRQKIQTIQDKIKRAIEQIEQEEQVSISFGTRSYDNAKYTTKMTVKTTAEDENTVVAVTNVDTRMSRSYGFSENIIGKTFIGGRTGQVHTIIEFKTRNRKYPIISTCGVTGQSFKHTVSQIENHLR